MNKIKIKLLLIFAFLICFININAQQKPIGCPRNFDGKTFTLIKSEILNHTGKSVSFDGEVIEIEIAYNEKPYFKVKFENEETIWIASMIVDENVKIGAKLRLLGYIDSVKKDDEIGNKFNKDILRTYLVELQKNFTGNASKLIDDIYRKFKLDQFSLNLLNHPSWNKRCQGLEELAIMNIKVEKDVLTKLLNENNLVVAMEAEVAQLQIEDGVAFRFLDEAEIEMSEWHQVRLMQAIKEFSVDKIPDFSRWLNHSLFSVRKFSLRMIREYNQFENFDKVSILLKDSNPGVVNEALKTISYLGNCDNNTKIIEMYPSFNFENKIECLKTFGKLCDELTFDFLLHKLRSEHFEIASQAAQSLNNFDQKGIEALENELTNCSPMLYSIIKHQLNTLLNPRN